MLKRSLGCTAAILDLLIMVMDMVTWDTRTMDTDGDTLTTVSFLALKSLTPESLAFYID